MSSGLYYLPKEIQWIEEPDITMYVMFVLSTNQEVPEVREED